MKYRRLYWTDYVARVRETKKARRILDKTHAKVHLEDREGCVRITLR
jgi:hypothetical protein